MHDSRFLWVAGLIVVLGLLIGPVIYFYPEGEVQRDDPWGKLPTRLPHTDHAALIQGPFEDGPSVTRACMKCHIEAAQEVMQTAHWRWEGDAVIVPGHSRAVRIGKKNLINNFCIGVQSNWYGCTSCHAGYGWKDGTFDFSNANNVDCLVCHDQSGTYTKTKGGYPAEGVDLMAVARSVGWPTRENCGSCHFKGGGGDAVKHGDMDASLIYPRERVDVHMGKHKLVCIDCHRTEKHVIMGRSISVSVDNKNRVWCRDCHTAQPHRDERLNAHTGAVACQTCHIPEVAIREATKTHWDWSEAGQDRPEDPHRYQKIKGSFVYEKELIPEYFWFDGTANRYLMGDRMDALVPTPLNQPRGHVADANARIWPFKVHRGKQIYDREHMYFLQPKTYGEGGYWTDFDWDKAARLGSEASGLPYSGSYGFAETEMYWPLTHMVSPRDETLQCRDCHGEGGRMNWTALGYEGDPVYWGGRGNVGGSSGREGAAR